MSEVYRKTGRVARFEHGMLVRVDESGEAVEGARFTARPVASSQELPSIDVDAIIATADAITAAVKPLALERMVVSEGVVMHSFGDETWTESARRVHVSIARPPYRALVDLASFDAATIERVARLLAAVRGERESRGRVRLAEHVGAALLPSLCGHIAMQQWAAPHDGKGAWIENVIVEGTPPNWYRPSYRTRPVRAWFHLRVDPFGTVDRALPEAVALLAPVHAGALDVLCVDGADVHVSKIRVDRVFAAAPTPSWYPYGAGCFGAELVL